MLFRSMEGLGVLSVVLSLAFVALQIKQSNEQARAAMSYQISESYTGLHDLVAGDGELAEIVVRFGQPDPEFTPVEGQRAVSVAIRLLNTWLSVQSAYDNGLLTDEQFALYRGDVAVMVAGWPGVVPMWASVIETRPSIAELTILAPIVEQM